MPDIKQTRSLSEILEEIYERESELVEELEALNRVLDTQTPRSLRDEEMWELYSAGCSLTQVGKKYGVTGQRVGQIFKGAGYPLRSRKRALNLRKERHLAEIIKVYGERVRELYLEEGLSIQQVSKMMRISSGDVIKVVHAAFSREERDEVRRRRENYPGAPKQFSMEQLIQELKACANEIGRTPGSKVFDKWYGSTHSQLIIIRFGSWSAACEAAGLIPNEHQRSPNWGTKKYSDTDCANAFNRITEKLGHTPSVADYRDHQEEGEPTAATLRRRNDNSWIKARKKYSKSEGSNKHA